MRILSGSMFHINYSTDFHRKQLRNGSLTVPVWSRVSSTPNSTAMLSDTMRSFLFRMLAMMCMPS